MTYRILSNDVGPHQYSALRDISAHTLAEAKAEAERVFSDLPVDSRRKDKTLRLCVLPHQLSHYHNGQTGRLHNMALQYVVEIKK